MRKLLCILLSVLCLIGCSERRICDKDTLYYVISMDEDKVILYPGFYEAERHEEQKKDFIEVALGEKVEFYDTTINTKIFKNGKEEKKETTIEITKDNLLEAIEYDSAFVYVEYNDNNEIVKFTLYGELTVYE